MNAMHPLPRFSTWETKPAPGEPGHGYFARLVRDEAHTSARVYANEIEIDGRNVVLKDIRSKQTYLDNIAILLGGMAAEQVFLGEHGDGVTSDLDDATRIAMILDRHLGMNGVLNAWPTSFDIRMINDVRRHDSALLRRIEPILQEQLARAKTIIESRRTQISGLWLDLIDRGSLSGHEIEEKLWLENKIPMPTPRMRRKIRQRLS